MRVTHLNAILALLLWSGIDPAISLKYTYVTNSLSIPLLIDITPISSFAVMNNGAITLLVHAFWYVCAAVFGSPGVWCLCLLLACSVSSLPIGLNLPHILGAG